MSLFVATSLVIIPPLVANEDTRYSWSKEVINKMPGHNAPIQNGFDRQLHWAIPLNINWMRSTQPRKKSNQIPMFLHPVEKQCNKKILFPPLSSIDLPPPYLDVLPAQQVLVTYTCCVRLWRAMANGRLYVRKCVPQKPVTFSFMILGNVGSLIVSSS